MNLLTNLLPDLVTLDMGRPVTTSLKVAKVFGKRHDDVLRAIRKRVHEAGEWGVRNFTETPYIDAQNGQTYPMFVMTKNGFVFLAQKFSGRKAVAFQIDYIEQFDAMEEQLWKRDNVLTKRMQELIACEVESEVRAHFGSVLLHERKRELPALRNERARLEREIQPSLLDGAGHV